MTTRPERFGLTLIEAMACGTPVLGARMGSIPEIVVDGVTGFLCDSVEDAVAKVPRLAGLDRRACRTRVEREFSLERMIDRYLDAYARALELGSAAAAERAKLRGAAARLVGSADGVHGYSAQTQESRLSNENPNRNATTRDARSSTSWASFRRGARRARRPHDDGFMTTSTRALRKRPRKRCERVTPSSSSASTRRAISPALGAPRRISKRDGSLWVFHPKGRGASPTDAEVRSAGLARGLWWTIKSAPTANSHTATRFVIPLARR